VTLYWLKESILKNWLLGFLLHDLVFSNCVYFDPIT
jgi:hypothetical protein